MNEYYYFEVEYENGQPVSFINTRKLESFDNEYYDTPNTNYPIPSNRIPISTLTIEKIGFTSKSSGSSYNHTLEFSKFWVNVNFFLTTPYAEMSLEISMWYNTVYKEYLRDRNINTLLESKYEF